MKCLICGLPTEQFFDTQMALETYQCSYCHVIFKDPICHENLELQKTRYDLHENNAEDEGYRQYFQGFLDFVLPHCKNSNTALDFGCGRSRLLSDMLVAQGIDTQVYDPIYYPETNYLEQRYDLITSIEVFEHLHDPISVFEVLLSLLSPHGILAIRTAFSPEQRDAYLQWYYRRDPTHTIFFRPQTFIQMCDKMGAHYIRDNGKNMLLIGKV